MTISQGFFLAQRLPEFVTESLDSNGVLIAGGLDSAQTIVLIDSDYIQARQTAQDFAYSSLTGAPNVLDSADVALIAAASGGVDSAGISALIDSDYVQARQITFTETDVDTHLNTSTATSNQVLSWNGTDYDWVNQSSGGSGGIDSAAVGDIVDTHLDGNANHIIPEVSEFYNIGSTTRSFRTLHLGEFVLKNYDDTISVLDSDDNVQKSNITQNVLNDLSNVSVANPSTDNVLAYNGTNWVAAPPAGAVVDIIDCGTASSSFDIFDDCGTATSVYSTIDIINLRGAA